MQEVDPEQVRQERIQASLKEREREVQMSRSAQEKEWGRERDQLRKMEAQQNFKTLLVDVVRMHARRLFEQGSSPSPPSPTGPCPSHSVA